MDITTVTLIQIPDVTKVAQALNPLPKAVAGLGRNTLYDRLNDQVNGTTAHSTYCTSVSIDAGHD
jgi:hypothetical protein